jgi:hypothetical protein
MDWRPDIVDFDTTTHCPSCDRLMEFELLGERFVWRCGGCGLYRL